MSGAMGRTIAQSVAGIILLVFLLISGVKYKTQIDNSSNAAVQASNAESTEVGEASQVGVIADALRRAYYVPMEQGNLNTIHDPASSQWQLFYGYSDSEDHVYFAVDFDVSSDYLYGYGETRLNKESISYERSSFPSSQPFLDLIDYMGNHPDVFFNHSEFENQEPGDYDLSVGGLEGFSLRVSARQATEDERPIYYAIHKAIMPGEEVPEELRYVLDTIRTEFAEQIAGRPIPRPESSSASDDQNE